LKKIGIELQFHRYDVSGVEVYSGFYNTKTMSDTETASP